MKITELYKINISHHGFDFQVRKLQEECCELGAAINHFLTNRNDGDEHFHEEFVDVEIMIEQLRPLLDTEKRKKYREQKLKRMEKKLNGKVKTAKKRQKAK